MATCTFILKLSRQDANLISDKLKTRGKDGFAALELKLANSHLHCLHTYCILLAAYFCNFKERKEVSEMAAYAALLSVMHTIQQIQQHPCPRVYLDEEQVQSSSENANFLQNFLERYSSSCSKEEEYLSHIAGVTYTAEDVIESHIVDQIHPDPRSTSDHGEKISSVKLYQGLKRVIQDMDLIKKVVIETIKQKMGAQLHQLHTNSSASTGSVRTASTGKNITMVDFGDILNKLMDKLTGQQYNLQIIPIVGMGGIGKTTLARIIYTNPLIVQHFDLLAWVTISQEYSEREILLQVLSQENRGSMNDLSHMSEDELGERVHKKLWSRRYLIVMDDIWSIEVWDKVKSFFPDNNNGSRIMITTRLSILAFQLSGSHDFHMKFLDGHKSWDLFCEFVFGKEGCPIELENIGKEIVRSCRGLPLSIVMIRGLLTKSKMTQEYWEYTLENLNSLINLENNEHCLQILRTSFKELPIHLKPCFLYMGIFPEDEEICVSELIKLWVAEGILKPIDGKSLEVVAKEYFKELIDRNLILVHELRWSGKVKLCKIHDLLRDLCLREAQKQKFFCILRQQDLNILQSINTERRICIHKDTPEEYSSQFLHALESVSLTRSLLLMWGFHEPSPLLIFKFLRVYSRANRYYSRVTDSSFVEAIYHQANLRYLSLGFDFPDKISKFPSSWSLLWNLQTLKVAIPIEEPIIAPSEIWRMPQLRHIMVSKLELPDPLNGEDNFVLENLQTLSCIWNFKCNEEVVKRSKKLKLYYNRAIFGEEGLPTLYLNNLDHLQNLESLGLQLSSNFISLRNIFQSHLVQNITFLNEIPSSIGDIRTLRLIQLGYCSKSAQDSVGRIKEEQVDNDNENLKVQIGPIGWSIY